ncbi:hypothetical protein DSM106972_081660 [Dulcicalothrix desertica PCC 7102]|uniref:Uncharacterized protein n=1 Tax=Dulcicalothrix desertica PCC 7102 TaxID=232991 RepID=A0A433UXL4_9CYAN|nr:hypothetical protein [Dulcicalothrix desertica]RUS98537.1 hypothetical protein DSM106972_081660 [Dulcicalothrix desertica PCC 7102]TWH54941.1 hypothetical protein CAL7102_03028 [Dulcicalothrix desertica PCC 7102]
MNKLKYYTLILPSNDDKRKCKEIEIAKIFFNETFANSFDINSESDIFIQKQLLELSHNNSSGSSLIAQRCLLCFISWQIEQTCLSLEQQFGDFHGFKSRDLLGYVLDDDGSLEPSKGYKCLAREILENFDPDKSSLVTWTNRKVKQHRELNKYLLERGLYLMSDWAILNDTKIKQLPKILGSFHSLTNIEIKQAQQLLEAYHKIYRTERLCQRTDYKILGKCNPPRTEQLQAMIKILQTQAIDNLSNGLSTKVVMQKLQNLAERLREYRLHVRNASFKTISLDAELYKNSTFVDRVPDTNSNNIINPTEDVYEINEFLKTYRSQMISCLDSALHTVIAYRSEKLQKKDTEKVQQFLTALQLFHCQRLSMGNIAKQLNLRAQDAVARLLKLKEFRADVRQETLVKLQVRVIELAQKYSTPTNLLNLELTIAELLDEQIGNVIYQAEVEAASMQNNCAVSFFSQRLCQQLDTKN